MADEGVVRWNVPRVPTNDRGFVSYGTDPITCTYGSTVSVTQSSSAEGPHLWLGVVGFDTPPNGHVQADGQKRPVGIDPTAAYKAAAHLGYQQVRELADRLTAWLADHQDEIEGDEEVDGA